MKVSVIIPTHGRPELLERTLNSVIQQTYKNLEIIVVSDGFNEKTNELMDSFPGIKYYFYKYSRGANFARNYGVDKSISDVVAFLDDDDQWEPQKVEKQISILSEKPKVGLVYTGNKQVYEDSNISFTYTPTESGDLSEKIFQKNFVGSTSSVLIKKDIFYKAGKFDERLKAMQDYDLWIRASQITEIDFVQEPLLIYNNDRSRPQISSQIEKYQEASKIIKKKHMKYLSENPSIEIKFDDFITDVLIKKALRAGNNKKARELSIKSIKTNSNGSKYISLIASFFPYDFLLKIKSLF